MEKHLKPLITVNSAGDEPTMALRKRCFYQGLRGASTYALPPTPLIFLMETNCLRSFFRSSQAACTGFKGNNKRTRCILM